MTGVGEHEASPDLLGERETGLLFEAVELLGDPGDGLVGLSGDGGDAASFGEFPKQVEANGIHPVLLVNS
jgi:hypothetical protein